MQQMWQTETRQDNTHHELRYVYGRVAALCSHRHSPHRQHTKQKREKVEIKGKKKKEEEKVGKKNGRARMEGLQHVSY